MAPRELLPLVLLMVFGEGIVGPRRRRRLAPRGGSIHEEVQEAAYDVAAAEALVGRVARSSPAAPYGGFGSDAAAVAASCRDDAARTCAAESLASCFALHLATLRASAVAAFAAALRALPAPKEPDEMARLAVETELEFVAAAAAATPPTFATTWTWDAALDALRECLSSAVEDELNDMSLEGFDDSDLPSTMERLGALAKKHRGLALRAASLGFNVFQARVAVNAARRAAERRDETLPKFPLF